MAKYNVGILLFPDVETLDFAGPFEVFSVASELNNFELFNVFTIGKNLEPIKTIHGLKVLPHHSLSNCPKVDILIIPGGFGTRQLVKDNEVMQWVQKNHQSTQLTLTVCTGAMVLGVLGMLDDKEYTTHHLLFGEMANFAPKGILIKGKRFVKSGKIFTSAGISAGIDLSLHIVGELLGHKVAQKTARYMEYGR
ncbi:MAG: DJ-1/PfpI family protein [Bacteroidales bacterium]